MGRIQGNTVLCVWCFLIIVDCLHAQDGCTPIMMAEMAGNKEIIALLKGRCQQEEPAEEVLL